MAEKIDLRSDTVTKPSKEMLSEMFKARVGDDVFGEDPDINALQNKVAKMFGHEAALFCPSGTMTNQIAIKVHTQPGDEIICHKESHIFRYEGGGIAANSGVQPYLLDGPRGTFTLKDVKEAVHPSDSHYPRTAMVAIENTTNRGGGGLWDWTEIEAISAFCKSENLPFHVDGARLFNALVADQKSPKEVGPLFDSLSICFSKGLGCPVGSAIIGSKSFIQEAHRVRKRMGGGMRQGGFLARAASYALDHHVPLLADDHKKAIMLANALENRPGVKDVIPPKTNIVIFETESEWDNQDWLKYLTDAGISCLPFSQTSIRFVTHIDVTLEAIERACKVIKSK
ncbi:threonine aldolase family protein [Luteibaculum oceani]|uniref:Threonine aldolase n=1 Tax=Luteibaculum oceani TaxID=1294296 RepID=A0A5C6UZV6_9FLAO|nr:GntG family PLP-dependent aldolase [Luteibaculum oceani]TXC78449.1 threonine aldolase [Luteibaculum oceani]